MKVLAVAAILQFGGGLVLYPPLADAQQAVIEEPSPALANCITTHAPDVERAFDALDEGVTFLVQKVCAGAVADQMVERNRKQAAEQKARMDAICKTQAAQPAPPANPSPDDPLPDFNRAQFVRQMCQANPFDVLGVVGSNVDYMFVGPDGIRAPKAEALAAQTLLKLRIERLPKTKR